MDEKVKKRGWVKNAAIIFLAALVVLTFFSNTIMNASLPEVSTYRVMDGTITAKVRGTGVVTAKENFEVKLKQSRMVERVAVRVGDTVKIGDLLFTLAGGESKDLKDALAQLEALEFDYRAALINMAQADYSSMNANIRRLQQDLEKAISDRDKLAVSQWELDAAANALAAAKNAVKDAEKALQTAKDAAGDYTAGNEAVKLAENALQTAEEKLKSSQALVDKFDAQIKDLTAQLKPGHDLLAMQRAIADKETAVTYKSQELAMNTDPAKTDDLRRELSQLQTELSRLREDYDLAAGADAQNARVQSDIDGLRKMKDIIETSRDVDAEEVEKKKKALDDAKEAYNSSKTEEQKALDRAAEKAAQNLTDKQNAQKDAQTESDRLEKQQKDWEDGAEKIKSAQRALEDAALALSQQQTADGKAKSAAALDLERKQYAIDNQKELVEKLKSESTGSEITSTADGIVRVVGVTAGSENAVDKALITIEQPARGYFVQFSVPNEQTRGLTVGDFGEVSSYWWSDNKPQASLESIKNDPDNRQERKQLTFAVTGENIESGAQYTITIGNKGVHYETVVPNSAVHTDSAGSFVLMLEQRSSPLGTRYVATRIDLRVAEKDDLNSGVNGGLNQWDYVILSSSAPIKPGNYVRLAEGM